MIEWSEFHAAILLAFPDITSEGTWITQEGPIYYFYVPYRSGDGRGQDFDEICLAYNVQGAREHYSAGSVGGPPKMYCRVHLNQFKNGPIGLLGKFR
jgi:hypothetical protein